MAKQTFERIKHIDRLIHLKATGTPAILSRKLHISERTLYDYIHLMKEMGAPIYYSRARETYYYKFEGGFVFKFLDVDHLNKNV